MLYLYWKNSGTLTNLKGKGAGQEYGRAQKQKAENNTIKLSIWGKTTALGLNTSPHCGSYNSHEEQASKTKKGLVYGLGGKTCEYSKPKDENPSGGPILKCIAKFKTDVPIMQKIMHHPENFGTEQGTSIRGPEPQKKTYSLLKYIAERSSSEPFIKNRCL